MLFASLASFAAEVSAALFIAALIIVILNRRAAKRIADGAGAIVGDLGRAIQSKTASSQIQERLDKRADDYKRCRLALERDRGFVNMKQREVNECQSQCNELDALVQSHLDEKDDAGAAKYISQLNREKEHLERAQRELATYRDQFNTSGKELELVEEAIAEDRREAAQLQVELEMSKCNAERAQLAESLQVPSDNGEYKQLIGEIKRQIDMNNGVADTNREVVSQSMNAIKEKQRLREARDRKLLEEYKRKRETEKAETAK